MFFYTQYFFTFNNLEGTLLEGPVNSPDGEYTANAYYETYGGAAGGIKVWVKVTNYNTNKIIYYSEAHSHFSMKWIDENTLTITNDEINHPNFNSVITLDVRNEIYDQTGLACQSLLMKDDYKISL